MLGTFVLLALLRPAEPTTANAKGGSTKDDSTLPIESAHFPTMEVNTCRKWRLVSKNQAPLHTPAALRLKKQYTLSLRQVVTGDYEFYTNLPAKTDTEHAISTALILHPVYGGRAARDPTTVVAQADLEVNSPSVTHTAFEHTWSGVAVYEALCAEEKPGFPSRTFVPLAKRSLKTEYLAQTKPRIKLTEYAPVALHPNSTHIAHILVSPFKLSDDHLLILEEAEDEFDGLNNELVGTAAPLFSASDFGYSLAALNAEDDKDDEDEEDKENGCEEKIEIPRFSLPLYRAINDAKRDFGIDEFDPRSLVDGAIKPDTYEADMIGNLPSGLQPLFITYLQTLFTLKCRNITKKTWKRDTRRHRSDSEFIDNSYLRTVLYLERPSDPVPLGTNPMINEYWARRGHTFESLKAAYFRAQNQHAMERKSVWLTIEQERDVNIHSWAWAVYDMPARKPQDLEIPELLELPIELVRSHPSYPDEMAFARAYPNWEPEEVGGEEEFPECLEGDEAYECLVEYREEECLPGDVVHKRWDMPVVDGRKDSLSPPGLENIWRRGTIGGGAC